MAYEKKDHAGWEELACAIVHQAAADYMKALKKLKLNGGYLPALGEKDSCERFFRSEWMKQLTDIDGKWLMEELRKETGYDE